MQPWWAEEALFKILDSFFISSASTVYHLQFICLFVGMFISIPVALIGGSSHQDYG